MRRHVTNTVPAAAASESDDLAGIPMLDAEELQQAVMASSHVDPLTTASTPLPGAANLGSSATSSAPLSATTPQHRQSDRQDEPYVPPVAFDEQNIRCFAFRGVTLSHVNPALVNAAAALKLMSPLWCDYDAIHYRGIPVRPGERPTSVSCTRQVQFINLDNIKDVLVRDARVDLTSLLNHSPHVPTSIVTRRPYQGTLGARMRELTTYCGYASNWWISAGVARRMGWTVNISVSSKTTQLDAFARAATGGGGGALESQPERGQAGGNRWNKSLAMQVLSFPMEMQVALLNMDQLVARDELRRWPRFAPTMTTAYQKDDWDVLAHHAAEHRFRTGISFHSGWLRKHDLHVKPDAVGCVMDCKYYFYNVDHVDGGRELMESLGRFPTTRHSFLISGQIINPAMCRDLDGMDQFLNKYWITKQQLYQQQQTVKVRLAPNAVGFVYGGTLRDEERVTYNLDELRDSEAALAASAREVLAAQQVVAVNAVSSLKQAA